MTFRNIKSHSFRLVFGLWAYCQLMCVPCTAASFLYYNFVPDVGPGVVPVHGQLVIDPFSPNQAQTGSFFLIGYLGAPPLVFDLTGQNITSPLAVSNPTI